MTAGTLGRNVWEGLLDLLYPPRCLICGAEGEVAVCETCHDEFAPIPLPTCPVCGRPNDPPPCRFCTDTHPWAFVAARAASIYEGPLRHGIHELKYGGKEGLGEPLGAHLANRFVADGLFPPAVWDRIDLILPMPVDPRHRRHRGYNQADLLARPVAEMTGKPLLTNAVRRVRSGPAQVSLTAAARRANVTPENFQVTKPTELAGAVILLVDDVFTTGTTANACAAALIRAGAAAVYVAALAAGD